MVLSEKEKQLVITNYTDIEFPGALGGLYRFYKSYRQKYSNSKITFSEIKSVIETLPIYQIHVQRRSKFPRRKIKKPPGSQSTV